MLNSLKAWYRRIYYQWVVLPKIKKRQTELNPGIKSNFLFLAGNYRSGTTMSFYFLKHYYEIDGYHDNDPIAFDWYSLHGLTKLRKLRNTSLSKWILLKPNDEVVFSKEQLDRFNGSRMLFVYRHFDAVIRSMVANPYFNGAKGRFVVEQNFEEFERRVPSEILELYQKYGGAQGPLEVKFALHWVWINQVYLKELKPLAYVLAFDYHDLRRNYNTKIKEITDFLELKDTKPRIIPPMVPEKEPKEANLPPEIRSLCEAVWLKLKA